MIPIEVLRRVSVAYTHKNCPDGMATALLLKDAFRMLGTTPKIEFLAHNTTEHRTAGPVPDGQVALFCDIVPHSDAVGFLDEHPGEMVVLDHHKGAEDIVAMFGKLGVFADEKEEPGVSGAVLAFREVWKPIWDVSLSAVREMQVPTEDFARCVGARDTWQTDNPIFGKGQWISKYLMSKPASFWLDNLRPPFLLDEEVKIGRALFEAHEEAVRQAVEQCAIFEVPGQDRDVDGVYEGVTVYIFQEQASGFRLCSDVAEALRARCDRGVVAGFSFVVDKPGAEPKLLYSLRGIGGFDVAKFAKANGGGGHTAAAGFSLDADRAGVTPYSFLCELLHSFLEGLTTYASDR